MRQSIMRFSFIKSTCLLTVLLLLNLFSSQAQASKDQELYGKLKAATSDSVRVDLMLQISRLQMFTDISQSLNYCDSALHLAQENKLKSFEAKANDMLGILHTISGNYIEALTFFKQAVKIFYELDDIKGLSKTLGNMASAYQYDEDFENALSYQLKSLQISEHLKDTTSMCISYLNLGNIQLRLENFERSTRYFKQSYLLAKKLNEPNRQIEALNSLSLALKQLGKLDDAMYYIDLSLKIAEKNQIRFNKYLAVDVLGRIQLEEKKYAQAKSNFLLIKPEFEKSGFEYLVISNYYFLAETYLGLNRPDSASYYFHETLGIGLENGYNIHVIDAYKGLTKLHILNNSKDSAIYYFNKVLDYNINYLNTQKTKELERLQTAYETQKKEEEIALLEEQSRLKDALLVKRNYFIIILVLVLAMMVAGIFFSYKLFKLNQKKMARELENKALRAQMNPHFLFNSLNSIQRMYVEGKENEANEYMADFADLIRKVLENSNYSLITIHEEIGILKLFLNLERLRCKNKFDFSIEIDEQIDLHQTKIPPLIFQPFVENAIWHGILPSDVSGRITINIVLKNNFLYCSIKDNGVGFSAQTNKKHTSQGIDITEKRIGSKVKIVSSPNEGTQVSFTLKIK